MITLPISTPTPRVLPVLSPTILRRHERLHAMRRRRLHQGGRNKRTNLRKRLVCFIYAAVVLITLVSHRVCLPATLLVEMLALGHPKKGLTVLVMLNTTRSLRLLARSHLKQLKQEFTFTTPTVMLQRQCGHPFSPGMYDLDSLRPRISDGTASQPTCNNPC